MTLTLFMIVKNESAIITRCLDHIRPFIDHVVITDTGSTDSTPTIIEDYLSTHHIPGKVFHDKWVNFGHNRSNSFTNAQQWLADHYHCAPVDLSGHYLITIDADMMINAVDPFDKTALSQYQSWDIKQGNDNIHYDNRRVFRADLPYRCVGVTHEYWDCKDTQDTTGKLSSLVIDDRGDGGCKADKFSRDIVLLKKGIEDEPANYARYCFYLAQSYADSNDHENALTWYQKRIDAGGWNEELFVSHSRRGDIYQEQGKPEHAIAEWLKAYNVLPQRAETLYRIVHHYRLTGQNHTAYLFLKQAIAIPYPEHLVLFIEHPVYHYKLIEELSIIAYYVGKIKEGLEACELLLLMPNIPESVRNMTMGNHYFYIQPLEAKHDILSITVDEPYLTSSACLLSAPEGYRGVVRSVNYSMDDKFNYTMRDTKGVVRTKNYWIERKGDVVQQHEIKCNVTGKRETHIKGLEDVRICEHNGKMYGIGVSWEHGQHNHPSVVFFPLQENCEINELFPISYCDNICQKNWTLFSDNGDLCMVYSHHPLTILCVDPETGETNVKLQQYTGYDLRNTRGSANPIRIPETQDWLVLTHEVVCKDTRKYYHRFLLYSSDWKLKKISTPFYFRNFYVEFSLSVMYDAGVVTIPYSTKDNTTEMMTLPYEDIHWLALPL
jgi:glycosyltransferase involved in cell wall biosynthesis